ncbi:MAG: hypothetical protein Q9216_001093 [Gyalolechia sp. 2 TL-2023]
MSNKTNAHRTPKCLNRLKQTKPASYREHYKQWIHIEALEARICVVEEALFHKSALSSLVDPTAPSATFESIEARVIQLEARLGLFYTPKLLIEEHPFACPTENCHKEYHSPGKYYIHIRDSEGAGHRALRLILERKICLHCGRSFDTLNGLTSHERTHSERAGQESQGCRVTNALPYFDSSKFVGGNRIPVSLTCGLGRQPQAYSKANKDGERPCRQIARVFESLAEKQDDQASRELVAMLFSPEERAPEAITDDFPVDKKASKASRKKRARLESEELHFDIPALDSQQDTDVTSRGLRKRRKWINATAENKVNLDGDRPGCLKTNPSDLLESETPEPSAGIPWSSHPLEDRQQTPLESIENDGDPPCQKTGPTSKPDHNSKSSSSSSDNYNRDGNDNGRVRSATPSPADDRDEFASMDEELCDILFSKSPFDGNSTFPGAKLDQESILSTHPTSDCMNNEPTPYDDSQTRKLLENLDACSIPEVPDLPWSVLNSQ